MNEQHPIQIVKTRGAIDQFKKEGAGSSELPKWATPQAIKENARSIGNTLQTLGGIFQKRCADGNNLPVLLIATLNEDATAKSHRPNVKSVFRINKQSNVIGVAGVAELFVKIDNQDDLRTIQGIVSDVRGNRASKERKIGVAAIKGLTVFHPKIETDKLSEKTVKVRLIDYKSEELNQLAERHFLEECSKYNIDVIKLNYASGLHLYKIDRVHTDQLQNIATMDSVISVKEMPYYEITMAPEPWNVDLDVATPVPNVAYPQMGILDSGVSDLAQLSPWQIGEEYNAAGLVEHDIDRNHGTMVASIALYGDQLEGESLTGCGPSLFANCIVNTHPQKAMIPEDQLVLFIRDSIENYPEIKVWNISQGSKVEVSDDMFSEFAIALDEIQQKHNVLFCKSAGNTDVSGHRISQGAESICSITVGSVCQQGHHEKDIEKDSLSPFSRKGPGPEYLQKPDVVHYGGNQITGVNVVTAPGYTCHQKGTSVMYHSV